MEIKTNERIVYSKEKEEIFDIAPNKVTPFTGENVIGSVAPGTIAENARQDITKPFQSPNFKQGTTGWRLNSNGILEANGAIIT